MKNYVFWVIVSVWIFSSPIIAQVAVNEDNSAADASAMLDVKSTDKGMLIPRMTTLQLGTISDPPEGLMIYNTDDNAIEFWNGTAWYNSSTGSESLPVFEKLYGGSSSEIGYAIHNTSSGGYISSGYSGSSVSGDVSGTNHGGTDFWVVNIDASGDIAWEYLYGGNGNERGWSIQKNNG